MLLRENTIKVGFNYCQEKKQGSEKVAKKLPNRRQMGWINIKRTKLKVQHAFNPHLFSITETLNE